MVSNRLLEYHQDNTMVTMNISIPDSMSDWIQTQIQEGNYSSASDYVRDLIRCDQEVRQQKQVLQKAITEGLKSGISHSSEGDIVKEAKARLDITRLEQLRASINPNNITLVDIDQAIESGRP